MTASSRTLDALLKIEKGKFFQMGPDICRGGRAGFTIQNLSKLLRSGNVLEPKPGTRGFREYPELPFLRLDRTLGRPLRDLELYHAYWLVSAATKDLFTSLDADGFAFLKCNVFTEQGEPGPEYWLCDVTRVLDALDDESSAVKIMHGPLGKWYDFSGGAKLVFRHEVVGSARVFRLSYNALSAFSDRQMKDACKSAGLKGIHFRDATALL